MGFMCISGKLYTSRNLCRSVYLPNWDEQVGIHDLSQRRMDSMATGEAGTHGTVVVIN